MADLTDKTQNVNICSDDDTKKVDVITDGAGVHRLAMDGTITSDDSPTKYQLKIDFDSTGDLVTSAADVTLFSYTGAGIIDFVAMSAGGSGYYAILVIDGTERLRITMDQLGSDLGLANGTNVPLWVETANKNFRFVPQNGCGFQTGFQIKARAVGANVTIKHVCVYREKTI